MACILVIEPDPAVEALLVELVRGAGHDVRRYRNAVDLDGADAVLLEPEHASGLDAVRSAQAVRRVPVICVSISDKDARCASVGATYLLKPFTARSLMEALETALQPAA